MSEKHDPAGDAASKDDAGTDVGGEANPFAISPGETVPLGELPPLFERSASAEESIPDVSPPDLFDEGASQAPPSKAAPLVPPPEVDAGVEQLQARPADITEPESPKTIISQVEPAWPVWSDGGLPPLIIYGPTSFRRTPPSVPLEPVAPEPVASQPAADAPTFAAESAATPEPAELDEIFDSIDAIAGGPEVASPAAAGPMSSPYTIPPPMTDIPGTPPPYQPMQSGPATMSGHWPPTPTGPQTMQPMTMGPATMSGEWPPAPRTEGLFTRGPQTLDTTVPVEAVEPMESFEPEPELASIEASLEDLEPPMTELPIAEPSMALESPEMLLAAGPQTMALSETPFQVEPLPVAAVAVGAGAAAGLLAARSGASRSEAPIPVHATGYEQDASHGQTATEFFAHAHEDVEKRRGILSLGLLTRLAGLSGLIACVAGLAMMLVACAGMTPFTAAHIGELMYGLQWGGMGVGGFALLLVLGSLLFKSWRPSAALAVVTALVMGGGWYALQQFQSHVVDFNVLSVSNYLTFVGLGGVGVALFGGLIEHRRMREETHVLAALFSNVLASLGGGLLWWLSTGATLLGK